MAESRLAAISVSTLSRVNVKYAYALRSWQPTRPRDLVQLRQAHPVCILDDQRVAVAHIDAGLN